MENRRVREAVHDQRRTGTINRVLAFDEMPEDNADLATVQVEFPRLADESPASCPVPMEDVLDYLSMEVPDGARLTPEDLSFRRTARVADADYWVWSFTEPDGQTAYVSVSVDGSGTATIGYEVDYYSLTPEQFMLGNYHQVF